MRAGWQIFAIFCIAAAVRWALPPAVAVTPVPADVRQSYTASGRWRPDCPVDWDRLRRVRVSFVDFDGRARQGELIVLDVLAPALVELFDVLQAKKFPLQVVQTELRAEQRNDPTLSVTTTYQCRTITGSDTGAFSLHAYGAALDINALQNPFVGPKDAAQGLAEVLPKAGLAFLNRGNQRPGMVEPIVDLVRSTGFSVWGGTWNTPIDYMHFEVPGTVTQLLATLPFTQAEALFALHRQYPDALTHVPRGPERDALAAFAARNPVRCLEALRAIYPTAQHMTPVEILRRVQ